VVIGKRWCRALIDLNGPLAKAVGHFGEVVGAHILKVGFTVITAKNTYDLHALSFLREL
jgi:hypothetical protein